MLRHLILLLFLSGFVVASERLNLQAGSRCTRNGVSGTCVSVYDCSSSYLDLLKKDFAPICSFRGKEPIICCSLNNTRNFVINSNMGVIHKAGQKAKDKCIEYIHRLDYACNDRSQTKMLSRHNPDKHGKKGNFRPLFVKTVTRGKDARRDQFPHMALLGYGFNAASAMWLCGGTVISERYILTAGHCLSSPSVGPVKYVALGVLRRSDPPQLWEIYKVKRRIPYPEYKPPSQYHDILLLETNTEITFSRHVQPACLHATGAAGEKLYATGWGALGHNRKLADTLQSVLLSRYTEEECSKHYPSHRNLKNGYNHTIQMCYGDKSGMDTCKGDSGGPLQTLNNNYVKSLHCIYTVTGVTSYGKQCGISGGSGVYTRVIHYIPWIESIVWP